MIFSQASVFSIQKSLRFLQKACIKIVDCAIYTDIAIFFFYILSSSAGK